MCEKWQTKEIRFALHREKITARIDRRLERIFGTKPITQHFDRSLMGTEQAQEVLKDLIRRDAPGALIRFGLYEKEVCRQYLERINGLRKYYSPFIRYHIDMDAGMFSNQDSQMDEYAEGILSLLPEADIMAYWKNAPAPHLFDPICTAVKIRAEDLYPYPFLHPKGLPDWQLDLTGKRVLFVTAFPDSLKAQYKKRKDLWKNPSVLPEFQLLTVKAVQTCGGIRDPRFATWRQAFEYLLDRTLAQEFDIALISCGSYGTPLALELKKNGKKAIQWGGCYQLWFGLNGSRWLDDAEIQSYVNSFWSYPSPSETPPDYRQVNYGCYWAP